jgi:aspartyl-tRNA(Asn)/glutamyl-tRNA(Gln) amidotransferase subunit A
MAAPNPVTLTAKMHATIAAAAAALAAGETTATDLVTASLSAIAAHGPATNAFVTVNADAALAQAQAVDLERAAGLHRGPLHGMPISLKDLIDQAGTVTTAGSRVLRDRVPATSATVVTRLREAGAIVIGRNNLHEFAFGTTSEDSAFGPVRNPHDLTRSPGGSSGGSAAAVAAGMGLASIGTDTGGSIRIPAAACGVVGLKPSIGDVPTDGVIPLSTTIDHVGPLAKSVQDAAWLWMVLSGRPVTTVAPAAIQHLRLRRLTGYFDDPLDEIVRAAFERAVKRLTRAGVQMAVDRVPDTQRISDAYVGIVLPEAAHWHAHFLETRGHDYTPNVRIRIEQGPSIPAVRYLGARAICGTFRASLDAALDKCDALILPTLPIVAPRIGTTDIVVSETTGESLPLRAAMLKHTQLFNLTGHPAISLPVASTGLPVGLQIVGRLGHTARLLEIAASCELALAGADE